MYQDLFNTDSSSDIFASLLPNSVVVTDRDTLLQSEPLPDGKILTGTVSGVRGKSLTGTEHQISVTNDADEIKLTLPQDIDIVSRPRFDGVRVTTDVDFVFDPSDFNGWQEVRQTIVAAEPYAVDRTWTLPLISDVTFDPADKLTFAALEGRQTFTGPKSFWETMQVNDIVPVSNGSYNLGATDRRFRYLHLGRGSGTIDLGIDNGGRAELKLVSNGSAAQNMTFGETGSPIAESAWNWRLSGRDSGEGRNFNLYRGPYLTESDPEIIMQCRSDTGDVVFPRTTDSTDTKTGAVRFSGGIGVSKSVHATHVGAASVATGSLTATGAVTATSVSATDSVSAANVTATGTVTAASLNITDGITIPGLSADTVVGTDSDSGLQSLTLASTNGVTATVADGVLTVDTPQDLRTTAEPTFSRLTLGANSTFGSGAYFHFDGSLRPMTGMELYLGGVTVSARWKGMRLGDGNASGRGQANIVCNGTEVHADFGRYDDFVRTHYGRWRIDSRHDHENYDYRISHAPSASESGHTRVFSIAGAGGNLFQSTFHHTLDSSSTTTGSVIFKGGVGIEKALHAASVSSTSVAVAGTAVTPLNYVTLDGTQTITGTKTFGQINASGISVDGVGLQPANYVLTHSNQTIGGQKTFSSRIVGTSDIMIGTHDHGILRLSSYGGGDARIEGGYVTDAEYFLRFYCRGELVAEMNHGYSGSGRTREFHLYGGLYFRNGGNTRMNYYGVVNLNTSFVGEGTATINTNPAVTIRCARVGHMVTLDVAPSQTNFHVTNGNPALITQAAIPADYRPSSTKQGSCVVNNQSNRFTPALVSVNSLGIVKIEPGPNGYFTGSLGSNNNLYGFSISYNL